MKKQSSKVSSVGVMVTLAAACLSLLSGCGGAAESAMPVDDAGAGDAEATADAPVDAPVDAPTRTTLGIFVTSEPDTTVIPEAMALGVRCGRTTQDVTSATVRPTALAFANAGMGVVLHLKNGTAAIPTDPDRALTSAELATFSTQLGARLDQLTPALVAVENEENWSGYYSGTPAEYLEELAAAAAVAHAHHVPVTNGGINSPALAILVWQDHVAHGHLAQATDFAARAFAPPQLAWVRDDLEDGTFDGTGHPQFLASVVFAQELVKGLRTAPIDYVNFHWYIDDEPALGEALDYLASATGKPLVTTEIGQGLIDGAVVTSHLQRLVVERKLPFVIWYDAEGSGGARALHDAGPPPVLRPNGVAFAKFVEDHADLLQ